MPDLSRERDVPAFVKVELMYLLMTMRACRSKVSRLRMRVKVIMKSDRRIG